MHAPRSAAALQTAALQQSATTAAPVTLKVALWLKALHRSSHTALQPCSTAAQHPGKPAIPQHSSGAAQEPSDFQLRRPCSIAAMYSCLAAVLPCSNHRTRQRSMFGLPKTAFPIYRRGRPGLHDNFTDLGQAVRNCVLSLRVDGKGSSVGCVLSFLGSSNML